MVMAESGKVLSIGLGDLVSARNAALRRIGFDVVAAISMEEVLRLCGSNRFDVAVVGHTFSIPEQAEFVRCIQRDFRLPVILIDSAKMPAGLHADSHVHVDAPTGELVRAIERLMDERNSPAIAV
jgi:hypothetical protein